MILRFVRVLSSLVLWSACGDNLHPGGDIVDGAVSDGPSGDASARDAGGPDAAVAPTVTSTSPAPAAVSVSIAKPIHATFSGDMNPATITATTFRVRRGVTDVVGAVSYAPATRTATFAAVDLLAATTTYTVTVTTGATDQGGRSLAADHVWTFTTGACGQAPIVLRRAAGFAVLAGSTVTSVGATHITGDVGVSPGTAITGFLPGIIVGTQQAGTAAAAQGIADLTTAYNETAMRVLCPVSVGGNLGGMTLAPGLYKSTSALEISSGDLTLDGQGDADAVFIFQTTSSLMTTPGRQVILSGGAQAKNVFWQVGTSAAFDTTTAFQGTVMADQSITFATGATLTGRALARIALVSLQGNTIVKPQD